MHDIRSALAEVMPTSGPYTNRDCAPHLARLEPRIAEARTELARADAKAVGLLTFAGVTLTILIAIITGVDLPLPARLIAVAAAVTLAAACTAFTTAVRPNLSGNYGFMRYVHCPDGIAVLRDLNVSPEINLLARADELRALAVAAAGKYRRVGYGAQTLTISFALMLAAVGSVVGSRL